MADVEILPETTTEFVIRIGLYLGALFQFTCILAIIIFPEKASEANGSNRENPDLSDHENVESHSSVSNKHSSHRIRKQDKKKRR